MDGEQHIPMDSDLADSIAMLEQILEVMPQDVIALRTLYNMYFKSGQLDHAFKYLSSLADAVRVSRDQDAAEFVKEQLDVFQEENTEEVASLLKKVDFISAVKPEVAEPAENKANDQRDINEELALAWRLYEESQLSQEEYSSVLHDLSEISSKELDVPVSVLHVLNDRGFSQISRIINYISSRSGVPLITLSNFEIPEEIKQVLPEKLRSQDGALPFAFFGNDLLIGVLNPFNNMLVEKVEKITGHRCHTFVVSPEDYDSTLNRMRGK